MNFRFNKSGVIGSLTTTFVAIIVIVALLIIFIVGSYFFKEISGVDKGEMVDKKYAELVQVNLVDESDDFKFEYNSYFSSVKEAKFLLECEGIFDGKEMDFQRVLYLWNDLNTERVMNFVEDNHCDFGYFLAEKNEESFSCSQVETGNSCKFSVINIREDFKKDISGKNVVLKFGDVNLKISNLGLEVENV